MEEDLENLLMQDKHIVAIHYLKFEAPQIDLNLWDEKMRHSAGMGVEGLVKYLSCPMIQDDFSDHDKRRDWKCQLSHELREFYRMNSLNMNRIASAQTYLEIMKKGYVGENLKEFQRLVSLPNEIDMAFFPYDSHGTHEKMVFVEDFKNAIYDLLKYLGSQGR